MNTAISGLMEDVNALQEWLNANKDGGNLAVYSEAVESLLLVLSPFAPHLADEVLEKLGYTGSAYETTWPVADEEAAREEEIVIPVQVNGKLRTRLTVAPDATQEQLHELALASPEVIPHLGGKEPKKVIVVPGRLVNIVA
jgi:leucyl-tRNA synthetase